MKYPYELLNTDDLNYLSKRYFKFTLTLCVIVEELINYECLSGSYILNYGQGDHWVALYVKNNQSVFFDPFGMPADNEILDFVKNNEFIYIDTPIQKMNQYCCGYYCLYFLYYMNNKFRKNMDYTMNMFISIWDEIDVSNNDNILQTEIKKLL